MLSSRTAAASAHIYTLPKCIEKKGCRKFLRLQPMLFIMAQGVNRSCDVTNRSLYSLQAVAVVQLWLRCSCRCKGKLQLTFQVMAIMPTGVHQNQFPNLRLGCLQNLDLLIGYLPRSPCMVLTDQKIFQTVSHNLWECKERLQQQPPFPKQQGNCLQIQKPNTCLYKLCNDQTIMRITIIRKERTLTK